MKVKIEVSDKKRFMNVYKNISAENDVEITEDNVAFGIYEPIIATIYFVYESSLSGITWDVIKEQIIPYIKALFSQKRNIDQLLVSIRDETDGEEYELNIPNDYKELELRITDKLRMKLKK